MPERPEISTWVVFCQSAHRTRFAKPCLGSIRTLGALLARQAGRFPARRARISTGLVPGASTERRWSVPPTEQALCFHRLGFGETL
jgi:hypothetical protein